MLYNVHCQPVAKYEAYEPFMKWTESNSNIPLKHHLNQI